MDGDTVQRSWGDNHDVPGDVNPLHHKGNSKGHHFTKGKGKTFSSRNGGKGEKGKGKYSGIATGRKWWQRHCRERLQRKRKWERWWPVQWNLSLVWRMGATRNRDVGGKMSTWSGPVGLELNTRTTLKREEDDAVESANLESLEVKIGEWRALCSLENRFAVLTNVDEEGRDDNEAPAWETVVPQEDNDWVHVPKQEKDLERRK